jgi:hypothetical protein
MARRIRVKGVPRKELDASTVSFIFWTMAKRQVEEKRRREQQERDERQGRKAASS